MIGEITVTATVRLKDGRSGMIMGISHTAPDRLFDILLATGEGTVRGVPETQVAALLAPARPDLIRQPSARSQPYARDAIAQALRRWPGGNEVQSHPLMAPAHPLRKAGGR